MTYPPVIAHKQPKQTILITWAVAATLAASVSTGFAIFFWLQAARPPLSQASTMPSSPFLDLPESSIPGGYKWISKSGSESFITLNADHTFVKDGKPNSAHRWEITRDALVMFWLRSQTRFNRIEQPGVYVETMDGAETARMEKQE